MQERVMLKIPIIVYSGILTSHPEHVPAVRNNESLFSYCGISYRNYAFYLSKKHTINMGYSFFWKFIEDSFKNVYVELESLLFARTIYTNVQIKEKSPPF